MADLYQKDLPFFLLLMDMQPVLLTESERLGEVMQV
jgi:hypothetical protein